MKDVKTVLVTNEKIENPDLKIVHRGKKYNVSLERTIPMVEDSEFVEKIMKFVMLEKKQ